MERRHFAGEFGLGLAVEHAGLRYDRIEGHRMDSRDKTAETNISSAIDG
jgi:hypothetical protein